MTTTDESRWDSVRLTVLLISAVILLCSAVLFGYNAAHEEYPWENHDVSFLTYAGFEILKGSDLYVDFDEVNPPGAHFLQAALLGVAGILGAPEFLLNHLFVLALGVAGVFLLKTGYSRSDDNLTFILVTLAYMLVVVRGNFSNNVIPSAPGIPYDFGQREHLFSLLFVPYVLWRISGKKASRLIFPYLILLGYVAMFKPYWPLLVGAVELYVLLRRSPRSYSIYASLAGGMLLPYVILSLHSYDSFVAFFREVVPLVLRGGYSPYDTSDLQFVVTPLHLQMVGGGLIFLLCWIGCLYGRLVCRPALILMLVIVGGSYLSVLHQHKFWSYHGMVFFSSVVVLGAFLLSVIVKRLTRGNTQFGIVTGLIVVLLVLIASSVKSLRVMLDEHPPKGHYLVPVLREYDEVMFFSMAADYSYAPLVLKMDTVGPWREHFRVAALLAIQDPEERAAAVGDYAGKVAERIEQARPDLLLFAPHRQGLPPGSSIHDVLMAHAVVPLADYTRIPDGLLAARNPRLSGWVIYKRMVTE